MPKFSPAWVMLHQWFVPTLDATALHPPVWAAVLSGAGLGLLWGVAARGWMRLISQHPEFSWAGTLGILSIATVFGTWAGLAWAARRRGWTRWGHYAPRSLVVVFFLPFGVAGGGPLMLTVLMATLAATQPIGGLWLLAALALLLSVGTDLGVPLPLAGGLFVTAIGLTTGQWLARRKQWFTVQQWLIRLARGLFGLLALLGLGWVAQEIGATQPGEVTILALGLYLLLLYPLFWALRIGLAPRDQAPAAPIFGEKT